MAQNLEVMRRRIGSAKDLYGVVRVMKALAAANIRQCERTVESLAEYSRTIEEGLQIAFADRKSEIGKDQPANNRWGVVVFGSDQGMCGSFNEQMAYFALDKFKELSSDKSDLIVLTVGIRVMGRIEDARYKIEEELMVPSTVNNITPRVNDLLLKVEELRLGKGIDQWMLFHHRPSPPASYFPVKKQLLPVDPKWLREVVQRKRSSRTVPTYTMDWERLVSSLIRHYLFVGLYQAFAESMAAENSSRLASMQAAEKNIESHLSQLTMSYHQKRQQSITEELLDIVAGFETLTAGESKARE